MAGRGGVRKGAGRKPKPRPEPVLHPALAAAMSEPESTPVAASDPIDMLALLQDVALGRIDATALQVRAAIAAVQYTHTKRHDGGKKEERDEAAKKASAGRFGPKAPPKLVVSNG